MLKVLATTAVVLCTAFGVFEAGAEARELKMGAASTSSTLHAYYTSVGKSISAAYLDSPVSLETVGLAFNAEAMRDGKMDFGAVSPDIVACIFSLISDSCVHRNRPPMFMETGQPFS
jgi:TRAP-type uncharacterized transport system substrate-binding protein